MCHIWKKNLSVKEEIGPDILHNGLKKINITGGEPGLRKDLIDIVSVLKKKTKLIDINTNGYFAERLIEVGKNFPDVAFRISVDGLPELNDKLRGIENGFERSFEDSYWIKGSRSKRCGFWDCDF